MAGNKERTLRQLVADVAESLVDASANQGVAAGYGKRGAYYKT